MRPPHPSLRRNVSWLLVGNTSYRLLQLAIVFFLARVSDPATVGYYALAQGITAPIYMTIGLNLRAVRATDVSEDWTPRQYHRVRLSLNILSFLLALAVSALFGSSSLVYLVAFVAMGKAFETTSQLVYGLLQARERLDLVARSLLLRSIAGPAGFIAGWYATKELWVACAGLALGWLLTTAIYDLKNERSLVRRPPVVPDRSSRSLIRLALPMGATAGAYSLTMNAPRYALQWTSGAVAVGQFAVLAYTSQAVIMITTSLADSVIARMSRAAQSGQVETFSRNLRRLIVFAISVAGLSSVAAWAIGGPVFTWILGSEYVNQPALIVLMLGTGVVTLQKVLEKGLQAGQRFHRILAVGIVALLAMIGSAWALVPLYGVFGAALSICVAFSISLIVAVVYVRLTVGDIVRREAAE